MGLEGEDIYVLTALAIVWLLKAVTFQANSFLEYQLAQFNLQIDSSAFSGQNVSVKD